jgi:hypothetical protein
MTIAPPTTSRKRDREDEMIVGGGSGESAGSSVVIQDDPGPSKRPKTKPQPSKDSVSTSMGQGPQQGQPQLNTASLISGPFFASSSTSSHWLAPPSELPQAIVQMPVPGSGADISMTSFRATLKQNSKSSNSLRASAMKRSPDTDTRIQRIYAYLNEDHANTSASLSHIEDSPGASFRELVRELFAPINHVTDQRDFLTRLNRHQAGLTFQCSSYDDQGKACAVLVSGSHHAEVVFLGDFEKSDMSLNSARSKHWIKQFSGKQRSEWDVTVRQTTKQYACSLLSLLEFVSASSLHSAVPVIVFVDAYGTI